MMADDGGARDAQHDRRRGSGPSAGAFAGVGIQLGLTLALFAWLGTWLDRRLGTSPWLLILLVFVGASAGFYSIYHRVIGSGRSGSGNTGAGSSAGTSKRSGQGR